MVEHKASPKKSWRAGRKGQAIVEFAIALPVLLLLLLGIIEVGRMVFMYALVINSSRDAVRYASAVGKSENGYIKYKYCKGIEAAAKQAAYIVPLTAVNITYKKQPSDTSAYASCPVSTSGEANVALYDYSLVNVEVSATYTPLVSILPIPSRTISATSSRTIMGVFDLPNK